MSGPVSISDVTCGSNVWLSCASIQTNTQGSKSEKRDSKGEDSEDSEEGDWLQYEDQEIGAQLEDLQLPPELLLQQAFTGHSVTVDIEEVNAEAAKHKGGVSLHSVNHQDWIKIADVDFPDLPIWFDNQVCFVIWSVNIYSKG